jgi:hypothetical protein
MLALNWSKNSTSDRRTNTVKTRTQKSPGEPGRHKSGGLLSSKQLPEHVEARNLRHPALLPSVYRALAYAKLSRKCGGSESELCSRGFYSGRVIHDFAGIREDHRDSVGARCVVDCNFHLEKRAISRASRNCSTRLATWLAKKSPVANSVELATHPHSRASIMWARTAPWRRERSARRWPATADFLAEALSARRKANEFMRSRLRTAAHHCKTFLRNAAHMEK